jgi:hypothetical protein
MIRLVSLSFFSFLIYSCNNFYHGIDNIKECFEEHKEDLVFLKESGKDPNNNILTIGWYKTVGFTPDKLDFTTTDGKYPTEDVFDKSYKTPLAKRQIEVFKRLNLKFFRVSKTGATFMFNNTGKCIHLRGLDSIDYNEFHTRVRINRYKNGEKTGWIIPLDAHWYIYTDCD